MSHPGKGRPPIRRAGRRVVELRQRQAIDRATRERSRSWQDALLDGLISAGLVEDFPTREADAVAADALRHLLRSWTPPTDARPLVERVTEQAAQRVRDELPALVAQAVEDALAEEGE